MLRLIPVVVDIVISPNCTAVAMMSSTGDLTTHLLQKSTSSNSGDSTQKERFTAALSLCFAVTSVQVHDLSDALPLLSDRDEQGQLATDNAKHISLKVYKSCQ